MMTRNRKFTKLAALAGLAALAACDSSTGAGMGTVQVYLASSGGAAMVSSLTLDPPAADLSNPRIRVARVELTPGRQEIANFGESGQWFSLTPGENDVSALLGSAAVPAGDYSQLRLILLEATVEANGVETDLIVPSGTETGVKFNFASPVHVEENGATNLVVVFDLDRSYVVTGTSDPQRILFKPVIHASVLPGLSISGNVKMDVAAGQDTWVEVTAGQSGTVVSAVPVKIAAGTTANTNVGYELRFLPAGTYVVRASLSGCTAPDANVTVPQEPPASVDFALDCP